MDRRLIGVGLLAVAGLAFGIPRQTGGATAQGFKEASGGAWGSQLSRQSTAKAAKKAAKKAQKRTSAVGENGSQRGKAITQ